MQRLKQTDLFVGGRSGYHTYRIPALTVTHRGTLLAFCEGRKYSASDSGKINLLLRRSVDSGKTWSKQKLVVSDGDKTCGNPTPVVERGTGKIFLLFCKNPGELHRGYLPENKTRRTVWVTESADDGISWSRPKDITKSVKKPGWTWYATGPCHGIQLQNGRLLIPCDYGVGVKFTRDDPRLSHVIYSDDGGKTWKLGGSTRKGRTTESTVVETVTGKVCLNCRNMVKGSRSVAWSHDGGLSFQRLQFTKALVDPVCQASLIRFSTRGDYGRNRVLFSNPAGMERRNLTVRVSYDECRTWNAGRVLCKGPSAYSDLAVAKNMTIFCLYERGRKTWHGKLTLAAFNLEWLTAGREKLTH